MSHTSGKVVVALLLASSAAACSDGPVDVGAIDAASASAQTSVTGSPRDIAAIQEIVNSLDANWGVDAVAFAANYAGAEWVGPNGRILTDSAAITGVYSFLFSTVFAGTTRESIIRNITFLTGTIAVLDIDARGTGFTALPPGVVPWQPGIVRALERNILIKRAGEWRIILHQQTAVAPGVP